MIGAFLLALGLVASGAGAADRSLVVVNDVSDPVSLDPHREFDASSDNIVNQMFDGLVRLTADGRIEPALAVSWKRIDDHVVEFKLRRGVVFHNGEPFTAEAVKFSIGRQLDPKRPAPNASLIETISSVEVVDDYTARIRTRRPDGILLNKLPMFVKILPPRYLREKGDEGFASHPVGTGPFSFVRWDRGRGIELRANARYWMGPPAISSLTFKFMPMNEQVDSLLAGEADMITDLSGLETAKVAGNKNFRVIKAENFYAVSVIPNSRRSPFSDRRVRMALAYAIDRQELVRYAAKGNGRPLTNFTLPGEFGHAELAESRHYDPALAKRLLREALPGGQARVRLLVRDEIAQFGKVIAGQLKRVGFDPILETASQEEVFNWVVKPNLDASLPAWEGDVLITHYVNPTAHVYFPYMIFVHSSGAYSLARDAEFDALFDQMIHTLDPGLQKERCGRLERMIFEKCLAFSPVQVIRPYAMREPLRYQPQVAGMLDFRAVSWEAQ